MSPRRSRIVTASARTSKSSVNSGPPSPRTRATTEETPARSASAAKLLGRAPQQILWCVDDREPFRHAGQAQQALYLLRPVDDAEPPPRLFGPLMGLEEDA